ncbi:MAG TPA: MFS transporter, partial [Thermovirga lienii]|nr:MFS transporter [Thermovirga lienii]
AQKKAPESRSVVASLVTGVAFGLGGVLIAPLGVIADSLGLETTLSFIALLPWFPMPLFFLRWKNI